LIFVRREKKVSGKFSKFLTEAFLSLEAGASRGSWQPGTDVMILKIFSPNFSAKKLAFLTQNKANLC
jgi:hypothetical protein